MSRAVPCWGLHPDPRPWLGAQRLNPKVPWMSALEILLGCPACERSLVFRSPQRGIPMHARCDRCGGGYLLRNGQARLTGLATPNMQGRLRHPPPAPAPERKPPLHSVPR